MFDDVADLYQQVILDHCKNPSASVLTTPVAGKPRAEAEAWFEVVREMVTTGRAREDLGKLAVFAGVHKFPSRVKCAILAWHALMGALKGEQQPVSTETEDM